MHMLCACTPALLNVYICSVQTPDYADTLNHETAMLTLIANHVTVQFIL